VNTSSFGHASSHGIIGMRQRMAGFGGTLTVGAGRDNTGTQIRAELPL
jgi:signal transduction histidine kinase